MAQIRCRYIGCHYLDNGICTASTVDLDPDEGCQTFSQLEDPFDEEDWDDDDDLDGYTEWDDEDDFSDTLYDDDDDF